MGQETTNEGDATSRVGFGNNSYRPIVQRVLDAIAARDVITMEELRNVLPDVKPSAILGATRTLRDRELVVSAGWGSYKATGTTPSKRPRRTP